MTDRPAIRRVTARRTLSGSLAVVMASGLTLSLVSTTGCAKLTNSPMAAILPGARQRDTSEPITLFDSTQIADESSQTAATAPNDDEAASPFRDSRPKTAEPDLAAATASTDDARRPSASIGLDAETQARIDRELADADPEERAQWLALLANTPPQLVDQLLDTRRMTKSQQSEAAPRPADPVAETTVEPARPKRASLARRRRDKAKQRSEQQAATTNTAEQPVGEPAAEVAAAPQATWPPNDGIDDVTDSAVDITPTRPSEIAAAALAEEAATDPASGGVIQPVAFTTEAADAAADDELQRALETLISELEQQIADDPNGDRGDGTGEASAAELATKREVFLRLLYLMNNQQARSLQAIPDLPPAHQEFWTQLFWGLTNYFDAESIPEPSHRASEAVAQLQAAARAMQSEARLELRNAAFSPKIESFGNFVRYQRDEFRPGERVLVYVEARNFSSEPTADGRYRTRLKTTFEIHRTGPGGGLVERKGSAQTPDDLCNNRRHDYFHSYDITLPSTLAIGPHSLKLIVEDELSHRVATTSLPFVVK